MELKEIFHHFCDPRGNTFKQTTSNLMEVAQPWLDLYFHLKKTACGRSEDFRRFKAWLGCSPDVCEMIFTRYQDDFYMPLRLNLAFVLYFLKHNPTEDEGSSHFGVSRPTWRRKVWETLNYLDCTMCEVSIS